MLKHHSIYWRERPRQLFSFRECIAALTAHEARSRFLARNRRALVIGVKELAPCGRRAARGGRWVA